MRGRTGTGIPYPLDFEVGIIGTMRFPHEDRIVEEILKVCKPDEIILFGSRAKGNFRKGSDIDIAVKGCREKTFRERRKLRERLNALAGLYSVDLIFYEDVDDSMRKIIDETGVVVWKR